MNSSASLQLKSSTKSHSTVSCFAKFLMLLCSLALEKRWHHTGQWEDCRYSRSCTAITGALMDSWALENKALPNAWWLKGKLVLIYVLAVNHLWGKEQWVIVIYSSSAIFYYFFYMKELHKENTIKICSVSWWNSSFCIYRCTVRLLFASY